MGIGSRLSLWFWIKTSAALDRVEDPRETLEYAASQQHQLLRQVRRGLIEVATSRRELEQRAERLRARVPEVTAQAERALRAGREDLARLALERKQTALAELERLERHVAELAGEERTLAGTEQRLSARSEAAWARQRTLAARYTAAEAKMRVQEALAGVSDQTAELWQALQRAETKTERMLARTAALDTLVESGSLDGTGAPDDPVERELGDLATRRAVDAELTILMNRLEQERREEPGDGQTANR